jgi:hypothetical protein
MPAECSDDRGAIPHPTLTELANRFGSDKGSCPGDWGVAHRYTAIYERFLAARRFEPLRLLEIGVWKGASLRMWESYLPNAQIIGLEIRPDIVQDCGKRARVLIGDAGDERFLKDAVGHFAGGQIDIVIDDASHLLDQQVRTLEMLFPFLAEGGLYFVEDISGSRFKDGNAGLMPFMDFLDYSWNLAQQTTFFSGGSPSTYHNLSDVRCLSPSERDQIQVSFWNRNLESVHYFHDLCVFEKRRRQLALEDFKQADRLRPPPGRGYELRRLGLRSHNLERNASENGDISGLGRVEELTVAQSANAALSQEVEQLKAQLTAARGKLRSVWDFIFRLQAEHVAESAKFKAELATLNQQLPKLFATLVDLKRQNNALRVQQSDLREAAGRIQNEIARSRGETIQAARERDAVRLRMARFLSSKARLLKSLFRF